MIFYLNGKFLPQEQCKISILDRSFKFGDGVFETMSFKDSNIFEVKNHILRLKNNLKLLMIQFDVSNLVNILNQLIEINTLSNGSIRITISRGSNSSGYLPLESNVANIAIEIRKKESIDLTPKKIKISNFKKPSNNNYPTNIKSCQGLNSTLAILDAKKENFFDAILLDQNDYLTEASAANLFWFKNNILYTPDKKLDLIAGITRNYILSNSKIKILEVKSRISDLTDAEFIFLTNVNYKIMPISEIYDQNKQLIAKSIEDINFDGICKILQIKFD